MIVRVAIGVCALAAWVTAAEPRVELSAADKVAAEAHAAALASDEFEIREKAQKDLRELVFKDAEKAAAWDAWLAAERAKTNDPETLARLPHHVQLMAKLRGTWTWDHSGGEIEHEIVFNVDGSFEGFVSIEGKMVKCVVGKFSVNKDDSVSMEGITKPPDSDTFSWSSHTVLKGRKIEMKLKTQGMRDDDDAIEHRLSRKTEKKDGAAK